MNAPGSPSSALQITYFFAFFSRWASSHFFPAGNPLPPRPRRPERVISCTTSSRAHAQGALRPLNPPWLR